MATTTAGSYLIIARYDRDRWNALKVPPAGEPETQPEGGEAPEEEDKQDQAHEIAEEVFPERRYPLPHLTPAEREALQVLTPEEEAELQELEALKASIDPAAEPEKVELLKERIESIRSQSACEIEEGLQKLRGVRLLHTFHTIIFNDLHAKLPHETDPLKDLSKPDAARSAIVNQVLQDFRARAAAIPAPEVLKAPDTDDKDPGIGWMAVVEAGALPSFVEAMSSRSGPLWKIFNIEVIPLNTDRSTQDIYDFMTPVHWK